MNKAYISYKYGTAFVLEGENEEEEKILYINDREKSRYITGMDYMMMSRDFRATDYEENVDVKELAHKLKISSNNHNLMWLFLRVSDKSERTITKEEVLEHIKLFKEDFIPHLEKVLSASLGTNPEEFEVVKERAKKQTEMFYDEAQAKISHMSYAEFKKEALDKLEAYICVWKDTFLYETLIRLRNKYQ